MSDPPITDETRVASSVKGFVVIAIAILTGGVSATAAAMRLIQQVDALKEKVATLPTKDDLRQAVSKQQVSFVQCPGRGGQWVKCKAVKGEDEP